jgi:hypothetical protein
MAFSSATAAGGPTTMLTQKLAKNLNRIAAIEI